MKRILIIYFFLVCGTIKSQTITYTGTLGNQLVATVALNPFLNTNALVYLPSDYNTSSKRYPLLMFSTGRGHSGTDASVLLDLGPNHFIYNGRWDGRGVDPNNTSDTVSYICITPQPTPNNDYSINDNSLNYLIPWLVARLRIDTTRVYFTALSAGGDGTMNYIAHTNQNPRYKVAAALPMSVQISTTLDATYFVRDSVKMWLMGAYPEDPHGIETYDLYTHINDIKPNYARFTDFSNPDASVLCCSDGHCKCEWNARYDPAYTEVIGGKTMRIYDWFLLYQRPTGATSTNKITTGSVGGFFCIKPTVGAVISVPYSSIGSWTSGNVFSVELSNSSGSFLSGTTIIGTKTSTLGSDVINALLPANTSSSNLWKVRVKATNPNIIGTSNTGLIATGLTGNSISPSASQTVSTNATGNTLTVAEKSRPIKRLWFENGISAIDTSSTFPIFYTTTGIRVITCKSYFLCDTVISNSVTINVISTTGNKRIILNKKADNSAEFNGCTTPYKKGDTLVLQSSQNPYSSVYIHDCADSLTVINEGAQVLLSSFALNPDSSGGIAGGFTIFNCTHIHITGTGGDSTYGFKISSSANRGIGVFVYGRSAFIEVDHCEMYKKNAGFWIKEEQQYNNCSPLNGFPNWVLTDMKLHDNYIHNTSAEGMYLGTTAPDGTLGTQHPSVWCLNGISSTDSVAGSVPDSVLPMRLGNFDIYNNIIDSTKRGGIQLSDADSGISLIHDNICTNNGYEYNSDQGNGIVLGTYTKAKIYNNYINNSYTIGISSFATYVEIYNNTVLNSGTLNGHSTVSSNIQVNNPKGHFPTIAGDTINTFIIHDNIVGNKTAATNITGNNQTPTRWGSNNLICTSGTIGISAGIPYSTDCSTLSYEIVYDTITARHDTLRNKTFFRDSVAIHHADSAKIVLSISYYINGAVSNRANKIDHWVYNVNDTLHYSVPYDSLVIRKTSHDSIIVDTIWTTYALGIFYFSNGTVSTALQIDTAHYLGVNYLRTNITRGGAYHVAEINASGTKAVLTINNSSAGAAGYGSYADSLFTVASPEWATGRNEPTQNAGSMASEISDLPALITAGHSHGVKVTNGGFTLDVVFSWINWMQTHGQSHYADSLVSLFSFNMSNPTVLLYIAKNDSLLDAYSTMSLDACNLHWYEPSTSDTSVVILSNLLPPLVDYIKTRTGKEILTNETGTLNHSCDLLTAFIKQWTTTNPKVIIYFDGTGNGGNAVKLQDCFKSIVKTL